MRRSSHARTVDARDALDRRDHQAARHPAVDFLAAQARSPGEWLAILRRARWEGVSAAEAFLAYGGVAEEVFYRRLARRLGLRYVETVPGLRIDNLAMALAAGMAPILTGGPRPCYLVAPTGERVAETLAAHLRSPLSRERMFLTSPSRFRALALAHDEKAAAQHASSALSQFDPALSAAPPSRFSAFVLAIAFVGLAAVGCASSLLWVVAAVPFYGAVLLKLYATAASCESSRERQAELSDYDLPVYTVLAPIYREARVLTHLLTALEDIDYPVLCIKLT